MKLKNCNAKQFIESLNHKKVICFGAGSTLMEADCEAKKIEGLEDHIGFFIDNDKKKHGLKFEYRNHEFDIKSIETLYTIDTKQYVLLITCAFYVEIYRQLKVITAIADMDCYMYNVVCSYPELDIVNFFEKEIEKPPYKDWKKILSRLHLKDKHKGERCFVIGNGPSLKAEDLDRLTNEITFAANRIFKIFPYTKWRPTYYFCIDYLTYGLDHQEINMVPSELRFIPLERALAAGKIYDEITYYNRVVNCVDIKDGKVVRGTEFMFSDNAEEIVYGGQTVLYDALQMAVYMGFSEIYLYGVDGEYEFEVLEDGTIIRNDTKNHFSDAYEEGIKESGALAAPMYAMKLAFETANMSCNSRNIIIKNATRGGKLDVFERITLDELISDNEC